MQLTPPLAPARAKAAFKSGGTGRPKRSSCRWVYSASHAAVFSAAMDAL